MDYIIVAFRSRSHTIKFANILREQGFAMEIINTPKEAGVGCGLSVKISQSQLHIVKRALGAGAFNSFAGIFKVKISGGGRSVKSI